MDEEHSAPHQCPVHKKYDHRLVAVDRPQGYPDESTVEYEPMDEGIPPPQQCPTQKLVLLKTMMSSLPAKCSLITNPNTRCTYNIATTSPYSLVAMGKEKREVPRSC